MLLNRFIVFCACVVFSGAQNYDYEPAPIRAAPPRLPAPQFSSAQKPTPVPILKQINRHNEDGSYTYGYEGADGAFKIETKLPTGEVKGKYGYVDDTGKVRVVVYGATKYGFEPEGEGITVAPPTLVDETTNKDGSLKPEYTAEYYEQQSEPDPRRPLKPKLRPSYESYSPPQQFSAPERPAPQRISNPAHQPDFDFPVKSRPSTKNFAAAPLRPPPSSFSFDDNFDEISARPVPKLSLAQPGPVRPSNTFSFDNEPKFSHPAPAPSRPSLSFNDEPRFAPQSRPAPQYASVAAPAPRSPSVRSSGGVLDQLAKDYALPNSAAPLHDISFGYY